MATIASMYDPRFVEGPDGRRLVRSSLRWHYTNTMHLPFILESGVLRRRTAPELPESEQGDGPSYLASAPVIWFSTRQFWEPSAVKILAPRDGGGAGPPVPTTQAYLVERFRRGDITAAMEMTRRDFGGLARVGVAPEVAPLSWEDYARRCGRSREDVRAVRRGARRCGEDPDFWYVSLEPVPRGAWASVELFDFDAGRWLAGVPHHLDGYLRMPGVDAADVVSAMAFLRASDYRQFLPAGDAEPDGDPDDEPNDDLSAHDGAPGGDPRLTHP
ncbi:MAG: hypothetical protein WKG32_08400 [Gemmatimonadaceae bacterium]